MIVPIAFGFLLIMVVGIVLVSVAIITNIDEQKTKYAAQKATCRQHVEDAGHPIYEIISTKENSCRVALPDGRLPLSISWFEKIR